MPHQSNITFGRHWGRENLVEERPSKILASFAEAEAYVERGRYWSEPVLISDNVEMQKFLRKYRIADCATDGRLAYTKIK